MTDLENILKLLEDGQFNKDWHTLGLKLGLFPQTLLKIQASDADSCLKECISRWLERVDDVDTKGGVSQITLANALQEMGQENTADHIYTVSSCYIYIHISIHPISMLLLKIKEKIHCITKVLLPMLMKVYPYIK